MLNIAIRPRRYVPADFKVTTWDVVEPLYQALLERGIETREDFDALLYDQSELNIVVSEDSTWRHIRTTQHTDDKEAQESYQYSVAHISSRTSVFNDALNKRILASPFSNQPRGDAERLMFKRMRLADAVFRVDNIPLFTELEKLGMDSSAIRGAMTVEFDGQMLTMPQLSGYLQETDRTKREKAWRTACRRRLQDKDQFDALFDTMVKKRHQMALNAGYKNFRDYQFDALQRFDYTPDDCRAFHSAVEEHIVPVLSDLYRKRADALGLDILKPWDMDVDPYGRPAIKAFDGVDDLINKGIMMLESVDPFFGDILRAQRAAGRLDLESRPHKRPGGYNNTPLETIIPFMFANVTDKTMDINVLVHEAGHAAHNVLIHSLPLLRYRRLPIEMAELAAMGMELLTLGGLKKILPARDAKRAQEQVLLNALTRLANVAHYDLFQHKIYENPDMTPDERNDLWFNLLCRFTPPELDVQSMPDENRTRWHMVPHFFTTPFYYIEYGIAQLGALQLWRNYLLDPEKAVADYKAALSLGYTKPLPQLFATAGITFDFSAATIAEMKPFLIHQLSLVMDSDA